MMYLLLYLAVPCLVVAVVVLGVFVVYESRATGPGPRPMAEPTHMQPHELPLQAMFDVLRRV